MTNYNDLNSLKTIAKRLARRQRIAHHDALDVIAHAFEFPHWRALTVARETGWRPDPAKVDTLAIESNARNTNTRSRLTIGLGFATQKHGSIDGHDYTIEIDFEVLMGGQGWAICVEQAPSEKPLIEIYDDSRHNPVLDPAFVSKALTIAYEAAEMLRARIAADWPRRSTKPDKEGRALHPLFRERGLSREWHCLHCDAVSTGSQMAANMWHCPKCSATPIDILAEPFWKAA
ncbi:hypothetical protein [Hyphomonas sp.]|uniref:hypothetical protein n=1 Tax=Hyphomonas sp. TaxID=87 RepID=UPI00356A039E